MQADGEDKKWELFNSIISEIDSKNALDDIILIGGWALILYRMHYKNSNIPSKSTSDIDFLFRQPPKIKNPFQIEKMLIEKGFSRESSLTTKECRYRHHLLDIDFLIPLVGSPGKEGVVKIHGYNVSATRLRYLDIATMITIKIKYNGSIVTLPHPAAYTYGKYMTAPLRKDKVKMAKDIDTAKHLSNFIMEEEEHMEVFYKLLNKVNPSWNTKFFRIIKELNPYFHDVLNEFISKKKVNEFVAENKIDESRKGLLLLSDMILVEKNLEKYRIPVYIKILEGLKPSHIQYFVNSFLLKGKTDVSAEEINKSKRKKSQTDH
ncbi:MAG TPA: GSU2403 family nucleotidyltransferase fold protein [bacterium]|nr:GSU2403 family nucleotidyltransferase fold protein [bacterium]HQI04543.1 GSU2403 family nucleotidyltransferase fold protein [bacterium]HQN72371.1 GSU2403 family nucleotidyltransferase fold protein [bacterium]HQO91651.1 GSU2403 family nucleotidyltransferase fold protein [bacterium]